MPAGNDPEAQENEWSQIKPADCLTCELLGWDCRPEETEYAQPCDAYQPIQEGDQKNEKSKKRQEMAKPQPMENLAP